MSLRLIKDCTGFLWFDVPLCKCSTVLRWCEVSGQKKQVTRCRWHNEGHFDASIQLQNHVLCWFFTYLKAWLSEGGQERLGPLPGFKKLFFSFDWVKWKFTTFSSPWKNLFGYTWKNPLLPPPGKVFPTPVFEGKQDLVEKDSTLRKLSIRSNILQSVAISFVFQLVHVT